MYRRGDQSIRSTQSATCKLLIMQHGRGSAVIPTTQCNNLINLSQKTKIYLIRGCARKVNEKKTKILCWWWRFVVVYCTTINCLLNASCMVSDKKRLTNTGSTQKPCYQLQTATTTQCGKQSCCMPPHCCCLCFLFPTVGQLGKLEFCGICKPVIFCNETPQKAKYTSIRCCTFPHC